MEVNAINPQNFPLKTKEKIDTYLSWTLSVYFDNFCRPSCQNFRRRTEVTKRITKPQKKEREKENQKKQKRVLLLKFVLNCTCPNGWFQKMSIPYQGRHLGILREKGGFLEWNSEGMGGGGGMQFGILNVWGFQLWISRGGRPWKLESFPWNCWSDNFSSL